MRNAWRKLRRWFTLADAPVNVTSAPATRCSICDRKATVFITVRWMGGDPVNRQYCVEHRPPRFTEFPRRSHDEPQG